MWMNFAEMLKNVIAIFFTKIKMPHLKIGKLKSFRCKVHICGDFNVDHEESLVHSTKTDAEDRYCHDFSVAYDPTQIIDAPSRISDNAGQY